jgi:alkylation response protein AidB-like acyl-CoA dehydrogenase
MLKDAASTVTTTEGLEFSPELLAWREDVQEFLREHLTAALREELFETGGLPPMRGPLQESFRKALAARGWLGVSWPQEYGGLGLTPLHEWILLEECAYHGAPPFDLTETTMAQILLRWGTEEDKRRWLPGIARDDVRLVIGQSEPDAGVDLSRIATRADRDGDEFVINGQKIWNSMAHSATHEWLVVRTAGQAPSREGLSLVMVPMDAPGITIQAIWGWDECRTNQTFFDDVRVPIENLVGVEGEGFTYAQDVLELEGIKGPRLGGLRKIFESLVEQCRTTAVDGALLIDRPDVRVALGELTVGLEVARLLSLRTTVLGMEGKRTDVAAAEQKVWFADFTSRLADAGLQILQVHGLLTKHSAGAPLGGKLEELYRRAPLRGFAGSPVELSREIVAQRGCGLPGRQVRDHYPAEVRGVDSALSTPHSDDLRKVARDLLRRECTPELLRELRDSGAGHSPELWRKIAQLGWIGLPFADEYGGGAGSLVDLATICEEAGRFLLPTTYQSTLFAGFAIAALGTDAQREEYLPAIVRGELVATIATTEAGVVDDLGLVATTAARTSDGWVVDGIKTAVPHLNAADLVVVTARARRPGAGDEVAAFVTGVPTSGLEATPLRSFGSIMLGEADFRGCRLDPDARLGDPAGGAGTTLALLEQTKRSMVALQCAAMVGGAERILESTLGYVQERVQYDAGIGTFQSVQHRIADCRIALDAARLATNQAIWALSVGRTAVREVAVAKIVSSRAFTMATLAAHQYFGGMGYMKESDFYLWSERAKVDELVLGAPAAQLGALVGTL